ncbi:MAG TPA: hypothetical protein VMV88_02510 [Gallionella sp.]|nr:hypothetical protein [Gallionella sp.]
MGKKVWLLVGLLVILAAGAFVYLDPMDLDLLGMKQATVVAIPAAKKHTTAPVVRHPAAAPKAAAELQAKAPAPIPSPPAPAEAEPALAPAQATATAAPSVATVAPALPQVIKPAPVKAKSKPVRPKNLDLRHCLKLETDAAIAKCAGE